MAARAGHAGGVGVRAFSARCWGARALRAPVSVPMAASAHFLARPPECLGVPPSREAEERGARRRAPSRQL
eukprot:scaffold71888_cov32-Tisochrysis_lutea.AAC.1